MTSNKRGFKNNRNIRHKIGATLLGNMKKALRETQTLRASWL